MRFFDKVKSGAARLFHKVSDAAPSILGKITSGLKVGSDLLRKGSQFSTQVINNPIVRGLAAVSGMGPELGVISTVINGANKASQILGKTSNLTEVGSYRGDKIGVTSDILQRARSIADDVKDLGPQFV